MKKATASTAMLLCLGLIVASHLETQVLDGERIFVVDSVYFDIHGYLQEKITAFKNVLSSQCSSIEYLEETSPDFASSLNAVQQFSPPDSSTARITQLARDGEWLWAEVSFEKLEPVVLLLKHTPQGLKIWDGAIWSGPTHPWRVKNSIEKYLKTKSPLPSHRLLECVNPSAGVFANQ